MSDDRATYIDGLRKLADALEEHPEVPLPTTGTRQAMSWNLWDDDAREQLAAVAKAIPCAWAKSARDGYGDGPAYFDMTGFLGGLELKLTAFREAVCTRVVTGTREVTETVKDPGALAAVPEIEVTRTVEDVEWQCHPILAGGQS